MKKCYACNKNIKGVPIQEWRGYRHEDCFLVRSVLNVKPLGVKSYDATKISKGKKLSRKAKNKIIDDNTINEAKF